MEILHEEHTNGGLLRIYEQTRPDAVVDEYLVYFEQDNEPAVLIAKEDSPGEAMESLLLYKEQSK